METVGADIDHSASKVFDGATHFNPQGEDPFAGICKAEGTLPYMISRNALSTLFALGAFGSYLIAWFAPGVLHGQVYVTEDIIAQFFPMRAELYALAHGEPFTLWNPLPCLGMPRLGNPQEGFLSPLSLVFYLLPTTQAFSLYPTISIFLVAAFTFAFLRSQRLTLLPCLLGTFGWISCGAMFESVQHLPVIEAMAWLPASLYCLERFFQSTQCAPNGLEPAAPIDGSSKMLNSWHTPWCTINGTHAPQCASHWRVLINGAFWIIASAFTLAFQVLAGSPNQAW